MVILHGHINACERMCLWNGWLTFAASEHLFLNADRNGFLFIFFDVFVFFLFPLVGAAYPCHADVNYGQTIFLWTLAANNGSVCSTCS